MKRQRSILGSGLVFLAIAALVAMSAGNVHAGVEVGNGCSALKDPHNAGAEAAAKAKAALGNHQPKVVLVFDSVGNGVDGKKAMLEGVTHVFDASIVYGCSAYAPITQESNTGTVAVLAIGGNVEVAAAVAAVKGDHEACGKKIGQALKRDVPTDSTGHVVLLFGACHVPANDKLVGGLTSVLGEKFPVAGGAAEGDLLYYQGKVVAENSNLGLLLCGDFACGFAAKNAPGDKKELVIAAAGEAVEQALGDRRDDVVLVFAFDCGGRRGQMGGEVDKELALMKDAAGDAPIFGFYGSGETGPKDNDLAPHGVGFHIIICAIFAR